MYYSGDHTTAKSLNHQFFGSSHNFLYYVYVWKFHFFFAIWIPSAQTPRPATINTDRRFRKITYLLKYVDPFMFSFLLHAMRSGFKANFKHGFVFILARESFSVPFGCLRLCNGLATQLRPKYPISSVLQCHLWKMSVG